MGFPELGQKHPGQYAFLERMIAITRRLDATRPIVDNDGWEHTDITDICAIHDYTPDAEGQAATARDTGRRKSPSDGGVSGRPLFARGSRYRGQPIVLSEVGGFLTLPENVPESERDMLYQFYGSVESAAELLSKYRGLMEGIASLRFLAGFCYTQLTDIEQEINGLLTYGRQPKISPDRVAEIHREMFK